MRGASRRRAGVANGEATLGGCVWAKAAPAELRANATASAIRVMGPSR